MSAGVLALWGGLTLAADVPALKVRAADWIAERWVEVKDASTTEERMAALKRARLNRVVCRGLLPVTDWMRTGALPFRLRDTWRERTHARPELLAVMGLAAHRIHQRWPDVRITVGDISQPGCGQLRYGEVVRFVPPQTLSDTSFLFGAPTRWDAVDPQSYVDEDPRFLDALGPIWKETRITGKTRDGRQRQEVRRFDEGSSLEPMSIARLIRRTRKRLRDRDNVQWSWIRHEDVNGKRRRLRRGVWTDWRKRRWIEVIWRPRRGRGNVSVRSVLRIREAQIHRRKPTSRQYEQRYEFWDDGEAGIHVRRYNMLYEAHHASHMAGLDADLSYITENNEGAFEPSLQRVDAVKSWQWLLELKRAADDLGVPIQAMFVDKSIKDILLTVPGVTRRHRLWRIARISRGHDSHVHLRVGPTRRYRKKSIADLQALVRKHRN